MLLPYAVSGQALRQRWDKIVISPLRNKTDNHAIWRGELAHAIELVKWIRRNVLGRSTDMRRLTTGIPSEKCVFRRFRRCANAYLHKPRWYTGADKSLARPGRKQSTATEDFEFHTSCL